MDWNASVQDRLYRRASRLPRRAYAAWAIIAVNILWYFAIETRNGLSEQGMLASGAMASPLVAAGQWYRIFASMFVHLGLVHLTVNMISLASLSVVELLIGSSRFMAAYFLSGVAAALTALVFSPEAVVAGASGAIFGVFGVALALSLQGVLSKGSRNSLLFFLALNVVIGLSVPSISLSGHLGGLVIGMVLTWVMRRWRGLLPYRIIAWSCSVLAVLSLILVMRG